MSNKGKGGIYIPFILLREKRPVSERILLSQIAYFDGKGGLKGSNSDIAERYNIARITVIRTIKNLKEKGEIKDIAKTGTRHILVLR